MNRVGSLAGLTGATTEDRARIRLDELGFDLRTTATGHYRIVAPNGQISLDNHGSLTTALLEAERWIRAEPAPDHDRRPPPKARPPTPTDAERATWWQTTCPSEKELRDWKFQVALDLLAGWNTADRIREGDDPNDHVSVPSRILPGPAFAGRARMLAVREIDPDVTRGATPARGDPWTRSFTRRIRTPQTTRTAQAVRETLRRGELPTRSEQAALRHVLDDLRLGEFIHLARLEDWTVERAAEIARLAGTVNERICGWLNRYAETDRIDAEPAPAPQTALETWARGWAQPMTFRAADGRVATCPRNAPLR